MNRQESSNGRDGGQQIVGWVAIISTRLRYEARSLLGAYPSIYIPALRWMGRRQSRFISKNTGLVIEGFPRSGNTFTSAAFDFAQRQKVEIACHMHAPAQVIVATKLRIPTLIIVRQPKDAVVAWKLTNPSLGLKQLLRGYVRYHIGIRPHATECVVATFDQVTRDLGSVIARINKKFGTEFEGFEHTKENVSRVFAELEAIAFKRIPDRKYLETIPDRSVEREKQRAVLRDQFDSLRSTQRFILANQLFDELKSHAG